MPDFILINLGLNDQHCSSDEFVDAYNALLREIRKHCPRTRIFAMRPFHGSRYHGDDVAEAVKKMADPEIIYINSDGWLDEKDYADGVHPNVTGSQKAAARLTEFLQPNLTRWRRKTQ